MDKEIIGKCPACGGDIVETEKAFGCSKWKEQDGGCRFAIWKTIAGRKITKANAKSLLDKGKTAKLDGFVSKKKGTEFSAVLKLEEGDDGYKVVFDFEN